MISYFEASIRSLSIHRVGNKIMDEFYFLSEEETVLKDTEPSLLLHYFLAPFEKVNEVYNLYHPSDLHLNDVYKIVTTNHGPGAFHGASQELVKHLYNVSNHPKIKSGEFYAAYFENLQFEGELCSAFGIFKSEHKETYLKVNTLQDGLYINFEQDGVNLTKLDKGCLIINREISKGCVVLCIDSTGKEPAYWKDEFLGLKIVENDFSKTDTMLHICKDFISNKLEEEFDLSKSDKVDLLNKTVKYFKENESFDINEFSDTVIGNAEASASFKKYKSIHDEEFDQNIPDCFNISTTAVKKKAASFKPVIKLDKNFTVYVHGSKDLIEKGFDEDKSMNYYKVYFKEEL